MSERINSNMNFDVLGDVVETLRFRGSIFFHSGLAAPWGVSFPEINLPRFHISLTGSFFVEVNGQDLIKVEERNIVMLPNGEAHWIADQPGRKLMPSEDICGLNNTHFQEGEITNRLMCGIVNYDQNAAHPIFDLLPQVIHFPEFDITDPIWVLVMLIDAQLNDSEERQMPIVDRLTETLFLKLIYYYAATNESITGFMTALKDRRVHQALILIHQKPDINWSVELLAEQVGMSRATLTRRFQNTMSMAPMSYVTYWRITKAYSLIKYTNLCLEEVAESVGFVSARTLSKAFQRHYNSTPYQLRQECQKRKECSNDNE